MRLDDLDFGALYREHVARTSGGEKRPEDWDARAPAMRAAVQGGAYTDAFLARMDLTGCRTLLDVGCGPGTIGLALAPRLEHVHGLDYSRGMLDALEDGARARGLTNVSCILRAWDDPWDGVPVCDLVVASRSTHVMDMEAALGKLDAHARRRVYLTHRAGAARSTPRSRRPWDARPRPRRTGSTWSPSSVGWASSPASTSSRAPGSSRAAPPPRTSSPA